MSDQLISRTGNKADLPVLSLAEFAWSDDTKQVYVGSSAGNVLVYSPTPVTYTVDPNGQYTTVQSAIDQAALDGHVSNDNPAIVVVNPGVYPENVALKPGVNLTSPTGLGFATNTDGSGGTVTIVGNMTYAVSNGLTLTQNSIAVSAINLETTNGITVVFSGTSAARLTLSGLSAVKNPGGDSNPVLQMTNSGGSQCRLQNNTTISQGVAGVTALDIQQGLCEMKDRVSSVQNISGGTIDSAVKISNAATFSAYLTQSFFNGAATKIVELTGTSSIFQAYWTTLTNTLAGGHGIVYTAAGTGRIRFCQISINANTAGYIGFGAAGTFIQGPNSVIGTNRQLKNTLTISTDATTVIATA